jgi:hypothetical protein
MVRNERLCNACMVFMMCALINGSRQVGTVQSVNLTFRAQVDGDDLFSCGWLVATYFRLSDTTLARLYS